MSAEIITAILVGVAAIITAIAGAIVTVMSGIATRKSVAGTALDAGKKLDHITVLTNSTLTAANARIDALEKMVRDLLTERTAMKGESGMVPPIQDVTSIKGLPPRSTTEAPEAPKVVDPVVTSLLMPKLKPEG